jgi:hypothetical protein
MTGNASMIRNCVTNTFHVNMGMRMRFIPGARMLMIVVMKLNDAASELTPRIWMPMTQKSMFMPGEYCIVVSGAYANHPAFGAAPKNHDALMKMPPSRNTQ